MAPSGELGSKYVSQLNFGGGDANGARTRKEIMSEVIAKSKVGAPPSLFRVTVRLCGDN